MLKQKEIERRNLFSVLIHSLCKFMSKTTPPIPAMTPPLTETLFPGSNVGFCRVRGKTSANHTNIPHPTPTFYCRLLDSYAPNNTKGSNELMSEWLNWKQSPDWISVTTAIGISQRLNCNVTFFSTGKS